MIRPRHVSMNRVTWIWELSVNFVYFKVYVKKLYIIEPEQMHIIQI